MRTDNKKEEVVNERDGFVSVSKTVLGRKTDTTKRIEIRPFATDTAHVSVKYGVTIPLGDYSSARIDVMISAPCYVEEIVDVYNQVRSLARKIIDRESEEITGADKNE